MKQQIFSQCLVKDQIENVLQIIKDVKHDAVKHWQENTTSKQL